MKLKSLLLSALLIPASLFGATNVFDNTIVRVSEKGTGYMIWTNGVNGTVTNQIGSLQLFSRKTDRNFVQLYSTNGVMAGRIYWNGSTGFVIEGPNNNTQIVFDDVNQRLNFQTGNYLLSGSAFTVAVGVDVSLLGLVAVGSNLIVNANTTLGDGAARTITVKSGTMTIPTLLNVNANTMVITNSLVMFGTNAAPTNTIAKVYVEGNVLANNFNYNLNTVAYSANGTGTNVIDFAGAGLVRITNVTAGVTLVSSNLVAGRSVSVFFTGASASNTFLTLPTGWIRIGAPVGTIVTNKVVTVTATSLSTDDASVRATAAQQP